MPTLAEMDAHLAENQRLIDGARTKKESYVLVVCCDFVVDGGARAKNFAYAPAPAADLAGPVPLVPLDVTGELDREMS